MFELVLALFIFVLILYFYIKSDADLTLKFVEYFGRKPNKYFDSKIVWVTGCSSGIGEQLVYQLCKLDVPIKFILSARRVNELERIKLSCLENSWAINSDDIQIIPLDLMDFDSHKDVVDKVWNCFGKVDVVFHNAGQSQRAVWHNIETSVDLDCFRLNALAPTNLTRYLIKYYFKHKSDLHIVVTSSLAGVFGGTSCASYVAAKHALTGYFRALQNDFYDCFNLKTTICFPGLVYAPNNPMNAFTGSAGQKHNEHIAAPIALHMTPERCANLILISVANKLQECWITKQPVLLYAYLKVYYPPLGTLKYMVADKTMVPKTETAKLFPDKFHFVLFWTYVCLFVNQGILVTASKEPDGTYGYNTTTVVLFTECIKFCIAFVLFMREESFQKLILEIRGSLKVLALYLIPAFLYCLYNNLAFVNLNHYDPTSYFLLLNFRTVITGVIFQFLFKKQLTTRQWMALIILTLGCVVKQVRIDNLSSLKIELDYHLLLMVTQLCCSCFAGVYNEFLLKDTGPTIHIMVQNLYMYADSILMNVGFLFFSGKLQQAFTSKSLESVLRPSVLAIAANNGVAGITTSIFLKKFNSILKAFAGGIELLLTAAISYFLFGVPIDISMIISIALVSYSLYLYSSQPVVNKPRDEEAALEGKS